MNKKYIILLACVIVIILTVIIVTLLSKSKQKVKIEVYSYNIDLERTIEISDSKATKELNDIYNKAVAEENDEIQSYGLKQNIKGVFGDGRYIVIQPTITEYCFLADPNKKIEKNITMPEGLLDLVNELIK